MVRIGLSMVFGNGIDFGDAVVVLQARV